MSGPVSEHQRKSLTRIDSNSRHLLAFLLIERLERGALVVLYTAAEIKVGQRASFLAALADVVAQHRDGLVGYISAASVWGL